MKPLHFFLPALAHLCFSLSLFAAGPKPKIEPQPLWVSPIAVDYAAASLDEEAEDGYADLHYEKQVSLAQQAVFVHKAAHVLSETGVENLSQVSVDYDPSYEQLIFHSVRIIRGGQSINQLQAARIKIIQQEKELARFIYNGTLTAVLILDDLRKGDVLEYSYTLKGFNPIFKNKYAENYSTRFDVPIYGLHYRLLVPKGRSVTVANSGTGTKPSLTTTAAETIYEWNIQNSRAAQVEKSLPSWYDAYPMIMVSEYGSWKEVSDWATALFSFSLPLSPALQKKIDEIKRVHSGAEAQTLAALRFVQDEVRYTGIEMGESSHRPHAPAQVFGQRFGDCKDKAYLLCTLLKALGIEAYPTLINTVYKKTINDWLPSPTAFDHTTVCAVLNGKTYWFDATIAYQRGRLEDISFPDYQTGLVIRPGTTGFTAIPLQNRGRTATKETFYVTGLHGPVMLVVTTQFTGSYADDARYNFRDKSNKEIQKEYKSLYTPYFKKLDADSLRHEDDEESGVFTTKEYYTVRDFWKEEGGARSVSLEPYLINTVIKKPQDESRTMPFGLPYPASYEEEIEVHLPKDWPVTGSSNHFKTDAFAFDCEYTQLKRDVVLLKYRYENLKDHIAANDVSSYLAKWEIAEKGMAFNLSDDFSSKPSEASGNTINSNTGFAVCYLILGLCAAVTFLYRRAQRRRNYWE